MSAHGTDSHDIEAVMDSPSANGSDTLKNGQPARLSRSPLPRQSATATPDLKPKMEDTEKKVGGDVVVKQEPGQPPRLSRSASQKVVPRAPRLFSHLPDSTQEALRGFEKIEQCSYANKYMGFTEHAMECDCAEEWDSEIGQNLACGEDSDCINRATKIECVGDCGCGPDCQNQRFQKKQYAKVSVIDTGDKGYGLRAETNLEAHQLIYEYVGEVVGESQFQRRRRDYDAQGIRHFYFMSLNKGEFVDATKRGNLGRFCNHSCNPNCYVDKWVVGEKMRMGIFAERAVQAGEELVFNYNVDRYGADPQPCYCGEQNCTGFIGGRTQTERATKLSNVTIEALGIDDADAWDTVVARRPKKKKTEEDDEEYVDSVQPKSLDEDGVTKVMAALMQCQEKWIAVKLLGRIQRCDDERVRNRVVKMHGYQILNSQLAMWKEDNVVLMQILDILDKFPRLTRNKIVDSKIEDTIRPFTTCEDERVATKATTLLASWANLEVGYRIPRMKRGEQPKQAVNQFERRESGREQQRQRSASPPHTAPHEPQHMQNLAKGRRGGEPHLQRDLHHNRPRPGGRRNIRPPQSQPLPEGWYTAKDETGRVYYYSASKEVTWNRPIAPAVSAQPSVNKTNNTLLQNIIDGIMSQDKTPSDQKSDTPRTPQQPSDQPEKKKEGDWWKKLNEQKQRKLYENTLHPHIKFVMDQYKNKIPKEDLKRFAKDTARRLVDGDYKRGRVTDPTKISEKHTHTVRKFCKEFFDKAAKKHKDREAAKAKKSGTVKPDTGDNDGDVRMSDDEAEPSAGTGTATSPMDDDAYASLKRKRDGSLDQDQAQPTPDEGGSSPSKRQKSTPPPPPPPPPITDDIKAEDKGVEESITPPSVPPPPQESPKGNLDGSESGYKGPDVEIKDIPSHTHVEGKV
ncbi:Histone-lysine N-methyltransferase H3 lysine-36 specific [Penicillium angulare]|uniref:Histone-lysine N-methyltransferase H3 lysine-36 specific n=1 Tax=Penicillium angulare TaxID=116970 RepID=UPI0025413407|nr:Histone-lysine N-methyltransferase H3 lysine-36 specific [Penicillium angulare]KAJ5263800.1 Histone-lysine N-methyltransferase H3 lysine-36 specific [Penicillium angulare]